MVKDNFTRIRHMLDAAYAIRQFTRKHQSLRSIKMQESEKIDWHSQWQQHAHGFKDGLAHIDFKELGINQEGSIVLSPGPGFGDLSHPTTRLVLSMMSDHVAAKDVLDLGCGSGILTLSALAFGAKSAFGIDIDEDAIAHAAKNATLNDLPAKFGKNQPYTCDVLVMNMIRSEQKEAYEALDPACKTYKHAFTSGILQEEREIYLELARSWGLYCLEERILDGWMGFKFLRLL